MKHAENCPSFDFEYEVGSGMEIPNCTCGAETDYGTVTHPMEGLREDDYAALKAERDALSEALTEYVKIAERKNNIGQLLFFEQQMLMRAKKALSVEKHVAGHQANVKAERDALAARVAKLESIKDELIKLGDALKDRIRELENDPMRLPDLSKLEVNCVYTSLFYDRHHIVDGKAGYWYVEILEFQTCRIVKGSGQSPSAAALAAIAKINGEK